MSQMLGSIELTHGILNRLTLMSRYVEYLTQNMSYEWLFSSLLISGPCHDRKDRVISLFLFIVLKKISMKHYGQASFHPRLFRNCDIKDTIEESCQNQCWSQRYTCRVLQTIQMKLIFLCVWAERAILGSAKTALKFKYEI